MSQPTGSADVLEREDDPDIRHCLARLLGRHGYRVAAADDGRPAGQERPRRLRGRLYSALITLSRVPASCWGVLRLPLDPPEPTVAPSRPPRGKLLAFAALGALDFGLTWHLLAVGGGTVYEGNPVAAWWLVRFGWAGLAGFKAAATGLTAGLCLLISLRRPASGHRLLGFGCAVLAAVVLYSAYLCHDLRRRPAGLDPDEAASLRRSEERIAAGVRRTRDYKQTLAEVARDLRARRCTLGESAARLAATEQAQDPDWMRKFHVFYPGRTDSECLAISVLNHLNRADEDQALYGELRAEFQDLYGRPAPPGPGGEGLVTFRPPVQ